MLVVDDNGIKEKGSGVRYASCFQIEYGAGLVKIMVPILFVVPRTSHSPSFIPFEVSI